MEKNKGSRLAGKNPDGSVRQSDDTTTETLSDLGISKGQSSDWQKLGDVSDGEFEEALAGEDKPTASGIINGAKGARRQPMDSRALA